MTGLTIEELIAVFKELAPVELSEFVKAFEEEFDVTVVAPVAAVTAVPATGGETAAVEEEKDSFDIVLKAAGDKEVAVIEEIRALTSLGLEETKGLVDSAPKAVLEGIDKEAANKTREQLEDTGASIIVK